MNQYKATFFTKTYPKWGVDTPVCDRMAVDMAMNPKFEVVKINEAPKLTLVVFRSAVEQIN